MAKKTSNDSLIPVKRRDVIYKILKEKKIVSISELTRRLDVAEMTIRRDLKTMEKLNLLEITRGGALISDHIKLESTFDKKSKQNKLKKELIGKFATTLIEEGDTVFVNSGSTTLQFLNYIDKEKIIIVTNNVKVATEFLSKNSKIIMVGGELRRESFSMIGELALRTIRNIFSSKAIIGVDGFSIKHGITNSVQEEAMLNNLMIQQTLGNVIVVADSSKIGKISNFKTSNINKITDLVTDKDLDEMYMKKINNLGIRVHIADFHS